jgi:hypothetical protein
MDARVSFTVNSSVLFVFFVVDDLAMGLVSRRRRDHGKIP